MVCRATKREARGLRMARSQQRVTPHMMLAWTQGVEVPSRWSREEFPSYQGRWMLQSKDDLADDLISGLR